MGKFLCWLGRHKWQYGIDYVQKEGGYLVFVLRLCSSCNKLEEVPKIQMVRGGELRGGQAQIDANKPA